MKRINRHNILIAIASGGVLLVLKFIPGGTGGVDLGLTSGHQLLGLLIAGGTLGSLALTVARRDATSRDPQIELMNENRFLRDQLPLDYELKWLGQLSTGIVHDFNNLLAVIISNASLVQSELDTNHSMQGELERILASSHAGIDLTRQLLACSLEGEPKLINVRWGDVLKTGKGVIEALVDRTTRIHVNVQPDLDEVRLGDGQALRILTNLVINAQHALPVGGRIWLEASNLERNGSPFVCLSVKDNGVGIHESLRSRIFDLRVTSRSSGQGSGIGLWSIHQWVTENGGEIEVDSEPGEGSQFSVILPAHPSNN